jgi:hypothetical protein
MSRTIRRTRARKHWTNFSTKYTHTIPDEWNGVRPMHGTIGAFPLVPKEEKEYIKSLCWYHSDCYKVDGFYGQARKSYKSYRGKDGSKESARAHNKQELIKWFKDEEYEPMLVEFINKSWYNYWD